MTDYAHFKALPASERDALGFIEYQRRQRIGTHGPECHTWGPMHYECLLRAYAAAKSETAAPVVGRWYFVTNDGAATLCVDEADARESAAEADIAFPRMAPHLVTHLVTQLVSASQLAAAVADEREKCAQVCDRRVMGDNNREDSEARRCADAIRARAKEPSDG